VLASCASDELALAENGGTATGDTATVQICFTLSVDGKTATRAGTWGDSYDTTYVNDFERKIKDLQVLVLPDKELTGKNHPHAFLLENVTYNGNLVTGKLSMPDSLLTDEGKFVGWIEVFANCDAITVDADKSTNCCLQHSAGNTLNYYNGYGKAPDWYSSDSYVQKIPMWGFKKIEGIKFLKGTIADIDVIPMLRSLLKLKVSLDSEKDAGYTLTGAKLENTNPYPYITPCFWHTETKSWEGEQWEDYDYTKYDSVLEIPIDSTFHIPTWGKGDGEASILLEDKDNKCFYAYIGEISKDYGPKVTLTYTTPAGNTEEKSFIVGDYPDNENCTPINLVRNTVYDYTVSVSGSDVNVSLTTLPWNVASSSVGYTVESDAAAGLEPVLYAWDTDNKKTVTVDDGTEKTEKTYYNYYPYANDPTKGDTEAKYCYVSYPRYASDSDNKYVEDKRSGADFYFLVTAPEGAVWEAHLTNTDDFEFETESSDGKTWECKYPDKELSGTLDDGTAYTYTATSKQLCSVSTGTARSNIECPENTVKSGNNIIKTRVVFCRPYKITVKPKHPWYKFRSDATKEDGKDYYTYNDDIVELTDSGKVWDKKYANEKGEVVSGPSTELYITVRLGNQDIEEEYLDINPAIEQQTALYKGNGSNYYRFAAGNAKAKDAKHSIKIWQLKATNKSDKKMAEDNSDNTSFVRDDDSL